MTRASSSRPSRRTVGAGLGVLVGTAALIGLGPVGAASAHDYVVSSDPAQGSTLTQPLSTASITFNDVILDLSGTGSSNVLEVTDAAGLHYEDGCSTTAGPTLTTGVALGAPGAYTMTYQAVSADGHTVSNALGFTYEPADGTAAAEGAATRPTCDPSSGSPGDDASSSAGGASSDAPSADATEAAPAPTAGPTSTAAASPAGDAPADGDDANIPVIIGIGVGIVGLAVIAIVVVLLTSRSRREAAKAPPEELDEP